jgi:hypothetical protein
VLPLVLPLLSGVTDLGRSFYFKIAATNVAREAAHWATLPDSSGSPPTDSEILSNVAAPSQESFGLSTPARPLELAPPSNVNSNPLAPGNTVSGSANPGLGCGQALCNLQPDHAWLFISPARAGRTSLTPNARWTLTAVDSYTVSAPAPNKGGFRQVLRTVGGSLYPRVAEADNSCFTWTGLTLSNTTYTIADANATPYQLPVLTATVTGLSQTGSGKSNDNPPQRILFSVSSAAGAALQQTWSNGTSQGSVDPSSRNYDTVSLGSPTAFSPGTYKYQVRATSSAGSNCTVSPAVAILTVTVNLGPSPSPGPTPNASPSPSPAPSPSPTASPPGGIGPGPQPHGETITCTVIYYFSPLTPLLFTLGNAVYIVGTATLQATY